MTFKVFDALSPITTAGPQGGTDFTVVSYMPVPGIAVQACDPLDPSCAKAGPPVVSDDAGSATVTVPGTFGGSFSFVGAGYLPSKLYTGQLLADASVFEAPVAVLGTQETSLLALYVGVPLELDPDAGVGHAFFQAYDCFDRHAAGVTFALSVDGGAQTVQWYLSGQSELPSVTGAKQIGRPRRRRRRERPRRHRDGDRDARVDQARHRHREHRDHRGRDDVRLDPRPRALRAHGGSGFTRAGSVEPASSGVAPLRGAVVAVRQPLCRRRASRPPPRAIVFIE